MEEKTDRIDLSLDSLIVRSFVLFLKYLTNEYRVNRVPDLTVVHLPSPALFCLQERRPSSGLSKANLSFCNFGCTASFPPRYSLKNYLNSSLLKTFLWVYTCLELL